MTLFTSKGKGDCEKGINLSYFLGFCSSDFSYISRIVMPLTEYFCCFQKIHCTYWENLFILVNHKHFGCRKCLLTDKIPNDAETHPSFHGLLAHSLWTFFWPLSLQRGIGSLFFLTVIQTRHLIIIQNKSPGSGLQCLFFILVCVQTWQSTDLKTYWIDSVSQSNTSPYLQIFVERLFEVVFKWTG